MRRSILFRRRYELYIPGEPAPKTPIVIDVMERMGRGEKVSTMRTHRIEKGVYRIQLDFKPTYFKGFHLKIWNVKRVFYGFLSDEEVIGDLGLREEEVVRIRKHTTLKQFFQVNYERLFPKTEVRGSDLVYLHQVQPQKIFKNRSLTAIVRKRRGEAP